MNKKLRSLLVLAFLLGTASAAQAQMFIGAGAYGHYYKDLGFFPGIQARLGYEANEGFYTADIGFNYSPTEISRPVSVVYADKTFSQKITHQQRVSVYGLTFHGAINLGNDEQDFRVGLLAGFSAYEYAIKYEKAIIPSGYQYKKESDLDDGSTTLWNADVGIKGNYRVGNGAVYTELLVGFPLSDISDRLMLAGASTHYGIQLGYKLNINNTNYVYRNRY